MTRAAVAVAVALVVAVTLWLGGDAWDDLEQRRPTPADVLDGTAP
jgi:hypothetical protein